MLHTLLSGVLLGIILSITLGPAFFSIIQTSIDRGFKSAIFISIGVLLSDITLIFLSYFGLSTIIDLTETQEYIGIIGAVILFSFGTYTFFKKPDIILRRSRQTPEIIKPTPFTFIAKGFLMNFANPFLWVFWLAAVSTISQQVEPNELKKHIFTFFSATVLTVFFFDVIKSYIGQKIKKFLSPRLQLYVNRAVGILLVLFGIFLLLKIFLY